ncbi:discoidin domain-containing protein [Sphingomonas sp. NFR15]|uniref:MGH1-like glycoside hydrolase domain-containing protein n=1 Tax=Sphingomonas sp. NFR15 TaxID=1566282 RepID=UPI000887FEB2|nr:glycogen debranching protein [Sphingomonas sp. NFR15]SDA33028.1 Amylo-alpha-1,6-glucosidase [Sphingomonas sp. NFR15]
MIALKRRLRAALLCAAPLTLIAAAPAPAPRLDRDAILARQYGNDADWYRDRIPLFDSSDATLDAVYYYRWQVFRAHQRDLGAKGFISTEFLNDVGWQREPYASLNDATAFHINEGRWLRDRRFADDYINFLYLDGGNDRHFSESIADAVWGRYLVDHDRDGAVRLLPAMRLVYGLWDDRFDFTKGLYWIEPLLDATEYTISSIDASGGKDGFRGGDAFRPSINSFQYANAMAISRLSALAGDTATAADYAARAERLRGRVLDALWSDRFGHFIDRYKVSNDHVKYWDQIRGRELVGYLPWTFGLIGADAKFDRAWTHILSTNELAGPAGLRTTEPSYQYYMRQYRYDAATALRECQWNGPVWPFQTTQVLTGLANRLHAGPDGTIGRGDYLRLLRQYARMHYQGDRLDLEEDYDPATGKPIVGLPRSHHYFHSGFDDLVISGLAGITPQPGDSVVVDPLLPAKNRARDRLRWFAAQDVPYHGRLLSVVYDEDGRRYRGGAGLRVYVDGALAASRPTLGKLVVPVAAKANPPVDRPIAQSISLVRTDYPKPSASSGTDPERLHQGIDGRVWFMPELPNGWDSTGAAQDEWFAVDFGKPVTLGRGEVSFFAGGAFGAPDSYRLEYRVDGAWRPLDTRGAAPRANATDTLTWQPVRTDAIRLAIRKPQGKQVRLAELKLF